MIDRQLEFFLQNITFLYRVFSLTWPASMQIYWNKRKRLHKKRVQLPEDWFGTPIWPPWRHVKTLYCNALSQLQQLIKLLYNNIGKISIFSHLPLRKSAISQRECSYKPQALLSLIQHWSDKSCDISTMETQQLLQQSNVWNLFHILD